MGQLHGVNGLVLGVGLESAGTIDDDLESSPGWSPSGSRSKLLPAGPGFEPLARRRGFSGSNVEFVGRGPSLRKPRRR